MSSGIYIPAVGAVGLSNALDTTANNVANASTTGFKASRASFSETLAKRASQDAAFVSVSTRSDIASGTITPTDNPLDVAIYGDGYFSINTPRGVRYTRAGNFRKNAEQQLVTAEGAEVRAQGGKGISIPEGTASLSISAQGSVFADGQEIGVLEVVRFPSNKLTNEGTNIFVAREKAQQVDNPALSSSSLESSNVNIVREVVDLVRISRTYESMMRMIEGFKQTEGRAARELGGPK